MPIMATITATELATALVTDPKTVRRFLRADNRSQGLPTPGKGRQWAIEKKTVPTLRKRFNAWSAEEKKANAARLQAKADEAAAIAAEPIAEEIESDEQLDSLVDDNPFEEQDDAVEETDES